MLHNSGFSLVEIGVALMVLGAATFTLGTTFSAARSFNERASDVSFARRLAARQIAHINRLVNEARGAVPGFDDNFSPLALLPAQQITVPAALPPAIWAGATPTFDLRFQATVAQDVFRTGAPMNVAQIALSAGNTGDLVQEAGTLLPAGSPWHVNSILQPFEVTMLVSRALDVETRMMRFVVNATPDGAGGFSAGAHRLGNQDWIIQVDVIKNQGGTGAGGTPVEINLHRVVTLGP